MGAAGQDDIGCFFLTAIRNTKIFLSIKPLEKTGEIIDRNNFRLVNADALLLAEAPRLSPYKKEIQRNIKRIRSRFFGKEHRQILPCVSSHSQPHDVV